MLLPMLFSCLSAGDGPQDTPGIDDPNPGKTLASAYRDYFDIGAAITAGEWGFNSLSHYKKEMFDQFSSLTAENCMKPDALQKNKGSFTFTFGDRIVDYAKKSGKRVRGHALVWHNQSPAWMAQTASSKEEAQANMKAHIEGVLGHYSEEDVYCWDVVNEAISDDAANTYRTKSPWYEIYKGPEFIRDAFAFAREANPKVKLFYNDYNVVQSPKRARIVNMLNELKLVEDGLIDGIGMQAHWHVDWPSASDIETTIKTFADMGLTVHITELDIKAGAEDAPKLAQRYKEIFEVLRKYKDSIESVTFWGIADDHTWLTDFHKFTNYPFVFDVDHNPKQAYFEIRDF